MIDLVYSTLAQKYTKALKDKNLYALFLPLGAGTWMEEGDPIECYGIKNNDLLEFKLKPQIINFTYGKMKKEILVDTCSTVRDVSKFAAEQFKLKGKYDIIQKSMILDPEKTLQEQLHKEFDLTLKKKKSIASTMFTKTLGTLRAMGKKKDGLR